MAEVVLFHHALGITPGVLEFAGQLRSDGHRVHTPDLFEGRTFASIAAGMAYVEQIGFAHLIERGMRAAQGLPENIVYAGLSLGVLPAQNLAQTRRGARGALLIYACVNPAEFGTWPPGVPVQIHGMDADPIFIGEGDVDAARSLIGEQRAAELFLYPGNGHYFAEPGLPSFDAEAAAMLARRALSFLETLDLQGPSDQKSP
jgi:dienelactone hydrolase